MIVVLVVAALRHSIPSAADTPRTVRHDPGARTWNEGRLHAKRRCVSGVWPVRDSMSRARHHTSKKRSHWGKGLDLTTGVGQAFELTMDGHRAVHPGPPRDRLHTDLRRRTGTPTVRAVSFICPLPPFIPSPRQWLLSTSSGHLCWCSYHVD
ncbi:MAG: hypothetical protein QOI13_263 [Paraburkholderia sp.]|nr:hypothetical protein [Paraburkholderia sp.]